MVEYALLREAIQAGGLAVAVVCLTLVCRWLVQLNANHLQHWIEESRLTRASYDNLTEALTNLRNWCAVRRGGGGTDGDGG